MRFGLRSLSRAPSTTLILRGLTALLVPWTALLALAPTQAWFGLAVVKWAWVTFDVLLTAALVRLLRAPDRKLATLLWLAVTADALLTLVQALLFNLPRARHALDYVVIGVACVGPLLASAVLWRPRRALLTARSETVGRNVVPPPSPDLAH